MIGEGIATAHTVIVGAIVWAGAIGAVVAFVLAVVVGTLMLQPPIPRRGPSAPAGAPQSPSRDSRFVWSPGAARRRAHSDPPPQTRHNWSNT